MFIVLLTYKKPIAEVELHLAAHIAYLDEHFAAGTFVASGRKVPRTGGVILAKAESRTVLEAILHQDPFSIADVAEFEVIEFVPTKTAPGLESLIEVI
ncbi:YCII-related domain [Shewanella putrefaciens]|uniref:YciI family protein n=1 Tax=Shewanella putrefaciens TaxID=24 RepID=UPI000E077AAD|nr:YciI family protein [Shewanella putrefaciens]SUI56430.1 YCII-related domain [Shewanella putrefaciens]